MPVSFTSIRKTGDATYHYEWTGTGPYKIFLNGAVIFDVDGAETTDNTEIDYLSSDSGEPEPLEVIDTATEDDNDAQNVLYSPVMRLQWRGLVGTFGYRVQYYDGAAWVTAAFIEHTYTDEEGGGYFWYETGALAHNTSAQWRVLAVTQFRKTTSVVEYSSESIAFTLTPRRNPEPPSIAGTYANPNLTIAAR